MFKSREDVEIREGILKLETSSLQQQSIHLNEKIVETEYDINGTALNEL